MSALAETAEATGFVWLDGGAYLMGSDTHGPEEAPAHEVKVSGFWISPTAVTNREYARFVRSTGYRTVAERPLDPADFPGAPEENLHAGSMVFTGTSGPVDLRHISQWWAWTPGANWRRPSGPGSSIGQLADHPVVHVAAEDAEAYADWAGRRLPTEAEWEFAARGGLDAMPYSWGAEPEPPGEHLANFWHGDFPWRAERGFGRTTPVGSFPANGYGLFDLTGNVWEWTADWYQEHTAGHGCCVPEDPRGGTVEASIEGETSLEGEIAFAVPRRVIKGGSFLCADSYCRRYRPAARRPQMIDTGMSHLGFRCAG